MMNMDLTWVLAAPGNAKFIDRNFSLVSDTSTEDGKRKLTFEIAENPLDSYLGNFKKPKRSAQAVIDPAKGKVK